ALVAVHPDPFEAELAHHLHVRELRLRCERPRDDDLPAAGRDRLEPAAQLVLAGAQELRPRPAAVEVDVDEVTLAFEIAAEWALAGAGRTRDQQQPTTRCPPATRIRKKSMTRHIGPIGPLGGRYHGVLRKVHFQNGMILRGSAAAYSRARERAAQRLRLRVARRREAERGRICLLR